jgi:formylglycine-generating enzyme required for sulfatase activity
VSKTLMPMDFCIDQFEYPNVEGELPSVQMSWYEAKAACESDGKRLCDEPEITFACEGEEMTPYPYGYVRDQSACNIDKEWRDPWVHRDDGTVAGDRQFILLDQRVPSGSMPLCVSPFGVFDIVGNADEWAVGKGSMYHAPYASILHGGHWGKVRDRCRGTTTVHGPDFKFYVTGARCCSDASR